MISVMEERPEPDRPLNAEEIALVSQLTDAQVAEIDGAIISHATNNWRKVAMIVALTMTKLPSRINGIPDLYYAQRVRKLVEAGKLESDGNLAYMCFSEVRLPQ